MALDVLVLIPRKPFAWREFVAQAWFVARVSLMPTVMLAVPYSVLVVFTFNILLLEFGAADFSGTTAAFATVTQIGPIVTVLVVAGAGATAMCADLGARTIRDELDALRVMGINPIQRLVVPRVLAAMVVAVLLSSVVILVGLVGGFIFSVFVQHVTPGAYATGLTVLTRAPRCAARVGQGGAVRIVGRVGRVLQGHFGRWGPCRRWQCGQRNRGLYLHGAVRDQHRCHGGGREGDVMTVASARLPRTSRQIRQWGAGWTRVGAQTWFYAKTLRYSVDVFVRYRSELVRLIAQMGLGTGALAVIGGTVVIVGFLTMTTGALVAVAGYNQLADIGVEALTGFASAYFNVRLAAPLTAGVALAATIGAGATAQLGAMRINEEIDALEVMGIRTIAYLASTRVVAGVIVVIPLYCVAALSGFVSARWCTTAIYGQSAGVYDHYFKAFLYPTSLIWSFFLAVAMGVVIMLVHTYYGFTASGGPAGVGEAVGRAVRTSLVSSATLDRLPLTCDLRSVRQLQPVGLARGRALQSSHRIHPAWWTAVLIAIVSSIDVGVFGRISPARSQPMCLSP